MARRRDDRHGVLVVDKPAGMTSAQVVSRARAQLGARKVGHTGTLDPMATGVLPLCVGEATKLAGYLTADDKCYEGTLELGVETDTLDAEGQVTRRDQAAAAAVTAEQLAGAVAALVGDLEQVPPMYSAIKQGGQRLHKLARAGVVVDREPRAVTVNAFELLETELPRARFRVDCSKGTYVRALVRDLGTALGCGAVLTALRRVRSGRFGIDGAVALEAVDRETALIAPADALADLPAASVDSALVPRIRAGQQLPWTAVGQGDAPDGAIRLLTDDGGLLALVRVEGGRLRYLRVFRLASEPGTDDATPGNA